MTRKRAIIGIIAAIAVIIGIAVAGSNAGATSYYEDDDHQCYVSDCETTTTEYVEETTTTTEVTTTTSTAPETTTSTSTIPVPIEIGTPLIEEREPYVGPMPPPPTTQTDSDEGEDISFTG